MNVVTSLALLTCAVLVAQARLEDPAWPYANQNVARTNYCPNSGLDFSSRSDAGQPKINSDQLYRTTLPLVKAPLVVGQKGLVYGLYQLSENDTFIVSINQTGGEVDRMHCLNAPSRDTWSLNMQIVDTRYGLVASTSSGYHCVVGTDNTGALQFFWSAQPTPGQMIYSTWTSLSTGSIALLFNSSSSTTRLATIDLRTGFLSKAQPYVHTLFSNTPPPRLPIAVMGFVNIYTPLFIMSWPTAYPGFTAVSADTGEISWQHNITTKSTPVVDESGQSVYVLASTPSPWGNNITDYWLLKYSTINGEELWRAPLTSAINDIHSGTISFDENHNRVVVSGFGGVSQFDGNTGDLLWWIHDEPDALPTQVFISDSGDYFYMNGTDTCVVRWDQGHCEV